MIFSSSSRPPSGIDKAVSFVRVAGIPLEHPRHDKIFDTVSPLCQHTEDAFMTRYVGGIRLSSGHHVRTRLFVV